MPCFKWLPDRRGYQLKKKPFSKGSSSKSVLYWRNYSLYHNHLCVIYPYLILQTDIFDHSDVHHICIGIYPPLMCIKYFLHVAYMWHFRDIFVAGTYMAITWWKAAFALFTVIYALMCGLSDHFSTSVVEHICALWRHAYANNAELCIPVFLSHCWFQCIHIYIMRHIYIDIWASYLHIN